MLKLATATAILTVVLAGQSTARDAYVDQVRVQLARAQSPAVQENGFSERGQHIAKLNRGGRYERTMYLERGEEYLYHAACDRNCHEVRLRILDANDNAVSLACGNRPVAGFTPDRAGKYKVRLDMTGCREDECHFGVALVAR